MIFHFCGRDVWAAARDSGHYAADSLPTEGFIHCSDLDTVLLPANAIARGRTDLVLLEIDEARLPSAPRREPGDPGDPSSPLFPHVYGPIPVGAVVAVYDFPCRPDGSFDLPAPLAGRTP
ncbi:MAG TPA: DUF952 domain-containing protein [Micromonosporaceae bacterium]|nr:DUF952 domain-containing protein [Micromonosporaceae bacterium]